MIKPLLQLSGASLFAQAVSLLVMPLITRLHSPESLGVYQFFTTLALVLTPLASGSLAIAIQSSKSRHRAVASLRLAMQYSVIALIAMIVFTLLTAFLIYDTGLSWFFWYLPALAVFVFLSSNFQFAMAYLVNSKRYGEKSTYTITKSVISNSLKVLFSVLSKSGVSLVSALVVTEVFQLLRASRHSLNLILRSYKAFNWPRFKADISSQRVYPTYVTLTSVLGILMNWFPILVTGFFYGPEFAGLLGLAFMVVNTPVYPFIGALRSVCFGELAREGSRDQYFSVYKKAMLIALGPSILGIIVLSTFGEEIFSLVFSEEWGVAGQYAFICFIPISLALIFSPVYSTLNHLFGFQRLFFWIKAIILLVGVSVTSFIGYKEASFHWFLVAFAITMAINHVALFVLSVSLSIKSKAGR